MVAERYLFVTWEGGGTLPPQLTVARRLVSRGHEVAVLSEPPSRGEVEAAGCRWEGYLEAPVRRSRAASDDPLRDWEKSPLAAARTVIDVKIRGPAAAYARDVLGALERVDRHLLLTSRAFDYPTDPPANLRYVGPQLDDPVWAGAWTPPWPEDGRPLALLSLGSTFQGQAGLYRRVIEALGALPVRGLVTLGHVLDPADFDAPANVRVVASAPHAAVLERAAVSISHCGHGSVLRALAAGVPLVCLPIGRDQHENAARVAAHGAGVRLQSMASARRIRGAVEAVLREPGYRRAARALAAGIARELEGDPAVTELEALAAAHRPAAAAAGGG